MLTICIPHASLCVISSRGRCHRKMDALGSTVRQRWRCGLKLAGIRAISLRKAHDARGLPEMTPNFTLPSFLKRALAESLKRVRTRPATWSLVM
eukprot:CAMPEP_0177528880 /NCGR_PEP_ID=MMETSP0369-20130122/52478_1 /TAXON_ID=447022 ORGANISM="Scrippsiella hangoei-like, Strain SHHI-4" /NCGR_SAMPLE_ID=MMETSP0369 /ASSEMBLY_ACC=CAM_ASM_000364 /LENGTH=93 /DNA_ID=CAMNT_0019009451 /DNA_START=133 /DNA_END=414 /DNA_ORIENTATION=-